MTLSRGEGDNIWKISQIMDFTHKTRDFVREEGIRQNRLKADQAQDLRIRDLQANFKVYTEKIDVLMSEIKTLPDDVKKRFRKAERQYEKLKHDFITSSDQLTMRPTYYLNPRLLDLERSARNPNEDRLRDAVNQISLFHQTLSRRVQTKKLKVAIDQLQQETTKSQVLAQRNEDLTQEVEGLTHQNEDLTREVEGFTHQNEDLTQEIEGLTHQNEALTQEIKQQVDTIKKMIQVEKTLSNIREGLTNLERQTIPDLPPVAEVDRRHQKVMRKSVPHADVNNALQLYRDMSHEELTQEHDNAEKRCSELSEKRHALLIKDAKTDEDNKNLDDIAKEQDTIDNSITDLYVETMIRKAIPDAQDRRNARALRDWELYKEALQGYTEQAKDLKIWLETELNDIRIDNAAKERLDTTRVIAEELLIKARKLISRPLPRAPKRGDIGTEVFEISRRNFRESLETESQQSGKIELEEAADSLAKRLIGKKGGLLFDVDYTLIDPRKEWKMPQKWIEAAEKLLANNVTVAVISGKSIEAIEEAFDNAGPRGNALKDNIEIFGERGDVRKGPGTDGKKILNSKQAGKYAATAKMAMNDIIDAVNKNPILNDYKRRGLILQEIPMSFNELGGFFLEGGGTHALASDLPEKATQDSTIDEKKIIETIYQELRKIVPEVLKQYPDFVMEENVGFSIRLNPATTGLKLDKGDAAHVLVKDYELSSIVVCGDGIVDVAIEKRARLLVAANEFIRHYMSEQEDSFIEHFISKIDQQYKLDLNEEERQRIANLDEEERQRIANLNKEERQRIANLDEEERQRIAEAKDSLTGKKVSALHNINKELIELNKTTLQDHAFVGVTRPSDIPKNFPEVVDAAIVMVNGVDDLRDLAYAIANKISEMNRDP